MMDSALVTGTESSAAPPWPALAPAAARAGAPAGPGTDSADPEDAVEEPPAEQPAPSRQAMAASTAPVVRTYLGDVMPVGRASRRPGSPSPGHRLLTSVSHGGRQVRVFGGPA